MKERLMAKRKRSEMSGVLKSLSAISKKGGRGGRLADGRLRKDYPYEIVINLSEKQMAYARWVTDQIYGTTEYMAYSAVIDKIMSWSKVMPDDVQTRITNMD